MIVKMGDCQNFKVIGPEEMPILIWGRRKRPQLRWDQPKTYKFWQSPHFQNPQFLSNRKLVHQIRGRIWQGSIDTIRDSLATSYDIWRCRTRKKLCWRVGCGAYVSGGLVAEPMCRSVPGTFYSHFVVQLASLQDFQHSWNSQVGPSVAIISKTNFPFSKLWLWKWGIVKISKS